jgi:inhibitor of cysteine peptidase
MKNKFALSLLILAFGMTNVLAQNKMVTATKASPNFSVTVKSNPSTGYSWSITSYDKNLIKPLGHSYQTPNTRLIGASGSETFSFKVLDNGFTRPQKTQIKMQYRRPWQKSNGGSSMTITVQTR